MRKILVSAIVLTGLGVTAQFAGASSAQAQPVFLPQNGHALIQTVQYHDWRERERRHEAWRWHHRAYFRHYAHDRRGF